MKGCGPPARSAAMSLNIGGAATSSRIGGGAGGSSLETTEELFRAGKEFPEEVGAESVREGRGKGREGRGKGAGRGASFSRFHKK